MAIMEERTHLAKWGNSRATRIPSQIIKQLGLDDDQDLTVTIRDGAIVLTPVKQQPTTIQELFADWHDDGQRDHELDWGKATGHELPW